MTKVQRLEAENARMRRALEEIGADLAKVSSSDDQSAWRFVGGTEVMVCRGLGVSVFVDGQPRFPTGDDRRSTHPINTMKGNGE